MTENTTTFTYTYVYIQGISDSLDWKGIGETQHVD